MLTNNAKTTIRMDNYTKSVVDYAAKYSNQTRSAFMLSALREKSEEVIQERLSVMSAIAPMVLSAEDSKAFLEALERDFESSEALLNLRKIHNSLNIVDRT
ncbi:MAG: DUF1778 domain-containing protein [Synergistaceae bacterium]|nr:DUF1778 domain-containing protein [Synergistaceae bacterium]